MKIRSILVVLLLSAGNALASEIPLPLPRPPLPWDKLEPAAEPEMPPEPSACQIRLSEFAETRNLPPLVGASGCGATDVVRLEAIVLSNQTRVPMTPPATLRCSMAEEVARWVREDVAKAIATLGTTLRAIDNYDSYDCRGRNRIVGAKISEHGRANALDIRGFQLANRTMAGLTDPAFSRPFREELRKSVCARFMTVLGPGSDGYHETHVHLDLAERRGDYRMCQWDVRDPPPEIPLPRPRPASADEPAPG